MTNRGHEISLLIDLSLICSNQETTVNPEKHQRCTGLQSPPKVLEQQGKSFVFAINCIHSGLR